MGIGNLQNFKNKYKSICKSMQSLYQGRAIRAENWLSIDFDVSDIVKDFDENNSAILRSPIKAAHDLVRSHHRAYQIYDCGRSFYYEAAKNAKAQDIKTIDFVIDGLNNSFDRAKRQVEG